MNRNNIEINVLVAGRKVNEFVSPMDHQTYIEGREGSNFEIELVNHNGVEVEMIVSVDGLSINDGEPAGVASGGYIIPANSRRTIPGWLVDGNTAAKFFFAGAKGGSYAEQSPQGDAKNKGIIGAKVFARKQQHYHNFHGGFRSVPLGSARMKSAAPMYSNSTMGGGAWAVDGPQGPVGMAMGINSVLSGGVTTSSVTSSNATSFAADAADDLAMAAAAPFEQTLGTGFGEATNFNTTSVEFERGDMIALVELFYDDAQGLKRRGIDVRRPTVRPSAFPADEPKGCRPPAGWTGQRG